MICLPGMKCYATQSPPVLPELTNSDTFKGYPIPSVYVYYSGENLPNIDVQTNDFLTQAIENIDLKLDPNYITSLILNHMENNPTYYNQICQVVSECP
jgi:hypothetical protein